MRIVVALLVDVHLDVTRNAMSAIVGTEHLVNGATINLNIGTTRSDIGAVAATKYVGDGTAIYGDIRTGHSSGIATAVNVADGIIVVDLNHRSAIEVSLVTSTEHLTNTSGIVDINIDSALRSSGSVVAAVNRTCNATAVDHDLDLSVDFGISTAITKTAAIDVACDGAFLEPQLGDFCAKLVHVTLSRTTIDVAIDGRCQTGIVTDGDRDVIASFSASTVATTENAVSGSAACTDCATVDIYVDSVADGAAGMATAVNASAHRASVDIDRRRTSDVGSFTATESVGQGTVGQGNNRITSDRSLATTTVYTTAHHCSSSIDENLWVSSNNSR